MFQTFEPDDSMSDENCAICLRNFREAEEEDNKIFDKRVMRLRLNEDLKQDEQGCNHVFHIECITPWFAIRTTCPLCKRDKKKKCSTAKCSPAKKIFTALL